MICFEFYIIPGDTLQSAWEQEVENISLHSDGRKPSLMKVLIKVYGTELMLYGLILAAMEFLIRFIVVIK